MKTKKSYAYTILLLLGVGIIVNVISDKLYFKIDLTEDNMYTLSESTKNILEDVKSPITIKAYFSENLPPQLSRGKNTLRDMLIDYADHTDGNIKYEFIDPSQNEKLTKEVQQLGIQPININVRQKNKMEQQLSFMGLALYYKNKKEVIPFINLNESLEYYLSTTIKKLIITEKPTIWVIDGYGSLTSEEFTAVESNLKLLYEVKRDYLANLTKDKINSVSAVLLLSPKDSVDQDDLQNLDEYLNQGGKVFGAFDFVDLDTKTYKGIRQSMQFVDYFRSKNLNIDATYAMDVQSNKVGIQAQQGAYSYTTQVFFPYYPIITNFSQHIVSKGLESISLLYPSPLLKPNDTSISFTPLLKTSAKSRLEQDIAFLNVEKEWREDDFRYPNIAVAAAYEFPNNSKIILITDSEFLKSSGQRKKLPPDNMSFIQNSIDWLADDTNLVALRSKGITSRPIKQIEESTKTLLQYLNFLFPIFIVVIIGFVFAQKNSRKRLKRMAIRYEK